MLDTLNVTNVLTVIVCLVISITIHEFMHAYVGFKLGDTTAMEGGRVSFNPLNHIDPVMTILLPAITLIFFHAPILAAKPVPFNPARLKYDEYGAALLAAAGPFSNLALALVGDIALHYVSVGSFFSQALVVFTELNVALFVFNLVPIPPLDGSRVLYAFSPAPLQELLERIEPYGFFIIILLVLSGGFGGVLVNLNNYVLNLLP